MRIVTGLYKGKRIQVPGGNRVRPTTDRVREAIFSSLLGRLEGARVLDLFAGSGSLGLEALSRGAAHATFVEKNFRVVQVLRQNLKDCGVNEDAYQIVKRDVRTLPTPSEEGKYDWIFMDPPYERGWLESVFKQVASSQWLLPGGGMIVDHSKRDLIPEGKGWSVDERRVYGDVAIAWISLTEQEKANG